PPGGHGGDAGPEHDGGLVEVHLEQEGGPAGGPRPALRAEYVRWSAVIRPVRDRARVEVRSDTADLRGRGGDLRHAAGLAAGVSTSRWPARATRRRRASRRCL